MKSSKRRTISKVKQCRSELIAGAKGMRDIVIPLRKLYDNQALVLYDSCLPH